MPIVTLDVYAPDGTTLVDRIETARRIRWLDDLTSAGMLTFTISAGDESGGSLLVQADRIVKVNVYDTTVFAGVVQTQRKSRVDNDVAVTQVACVGLRGLLLDAKVYPEGGLTTDGIPRSRVRYFGWTSAETVFDSSAWTATASHGKWSDNPFGNLDPPRQPQLWPADAASAELIWATHTGTDPITGLGTVAPGRVYFRRLFNTDEAHDLVFLGSANDEVTWYLDGQEIQRSVGPYQWREYGSTPIQLPAGDHVLAALGVNLERPVASGGPDSGAWILGALLMADEDGNPATVNETWTVHRNGATGGTFRLKFDDVASTGPIAYNASAAVVKTALEDTHPSIEVTVTGTGSSGDPWVIEATGDEVAGVPHKLAYGTSALTGGATAYPIIVNTADGAYAPMLLKTDTTWKHLPYPDDVPGVNFGIILGRLFDEVGARGNTLDALTITFDDDDDSSGRAWEQTFNLPISVGTDMAGVVAMAEDAGLRFHIDPDGSANLWDVGHLGVDVRSTVDLEYAANLVQLDHERDGRRYDTLLIETEGGFYQEAQTPGTPAKEGFLSAGGFAGSEDFAVFSAQALSDYATQPDRTTATFPQVILPDDMEWLVVVGNADYRTGSDDGITWPTAGTINGASDNMNAVVWSPSLDLYVAVGFNLRIHTSPDGSAWTQRLNFGGFIAFWAVAWSPSLGLFVACGDDSLLYTSPDGITWTERTLGFPSSPTAFAAAWGVGPALFAVGGSSGNLRTSPDGITWTARTSGFGSATVRGICWSPALSLFVAVGGTSGPVITTSPAGVTWTSRTATAFSTSVIHSVAWSPELALFVAVGAGGKIATSPDGITWTARTSGTTAILYSVAWASDIGLFVAVGAGKVCRTSPDGITWTARTLPGSSPDLHGVGVGRIPR